jgi:hypothetical protein
MKERITRGTLLFVEGCTASVHAPPHVRAGATVPADLCGERVARRSAASIYHSPMTDSRRSGFRITVHVNDDRGTPFDTGAAPHPCDRGMVKQRVGCQGGRTAPRAFRVHLKRDPSQ